MTIALIQVQPAGTLTGYSGPVVSYNNIGVGKLANMAAPLSAPELLFVESTLANDVGKESSYLIKMQNYVAPPVGSPYGTPDPLLQVHTVIKADTSVFTESQIQDACKRMSHLLWSTGVIAAILRGDK